MSEEVTARFQKENSGHKTFSTRSHFSSEMQQLFSSIKNKTCRPLILICGIPPHLCMNTRFNELREIYLFLKADRLIRLKLFELNPRRSIFKTLKTGRAFEKIPY
jgi:hypothetical protein